MEYNILEMADKAVQIARNGTEDDKEGLALQLSALPPDIAAAFRREMIFAIARQMNVTRDVPNETYSREKTHVY